MPLEPTPHVPSPSSLPRRGKGRGSCFPSPKAHTSDSSDELIAREVPGPGWDPGPRRVAISQGQSDMERWGAGTQRSSAEHRQSQGRGGPRDPRTGNRQPAWRCVAPGALLGLSGGAPHPAPPSGVPGGPQPRTLSTAANKHPSPAAGNVARDRPPGSAGPAPRPAQPVTAAPGLAGPQGEAGTPGRLGWRAREALCRAGGPRRLFPGPPGVPAYLARAPPGAGGLVQPVLS